MCEKEREKGRHPQTVAKVKVKSEVGVCLLQAETRSEWVTLKSVNPHSEAFVAYCLTSQQQPSQGRGWHHGIKKRAEGLFFFPDAIDLGLYLKVEFTGKDLQSYLDNSVLIIRVDFQTPTRVIEN